MDEGEIFSYFQEVEIDLELFFVLRGSLVALGDFGEVERVFELLDGTFLLDYLDGLLEVGKHLVVVVFLNLKDLDDLRD